MRDSLEELIRYIDLQSVPSGVDDSICAEHGVGHGLWTVRRNADFQDSDLASVDISS